MNLLRELVGRHRRYHQLEPQMLRYAAMVGLVAYPLFYLARFTKSSPGYDDWSLRLAAMLACLLILFPNHWPRALKPYFHLVAWAVPIFCLPFLFVFTSLKNGGGPVAVGNTLMAAFFIILLTDRRNMFVMLAVGFILAFGVYWAFEPNPQLPLDYVARLPILLVVVAGGSLFKHGVERAATIRVRQAYASLAGSIAHEMRNPLAQFKLSLEAFQRVLPAPASDVERQELAAGDLNTLYEHIAQGELAVQRGLQVIAMTLDEVHDVPLNADGFSRLTAGETCARAVHEFGYEDASHRAQVSLRVECDFFFRADETAFLFVLFNLIKNALANPGVQVQIVVDAGQVEVRDDGPGIAPAVQARLFQPFYSQGKAGGTGLGLAYCSRVMGAFGGNISCSSVPGRSTCFRLTLPLVTAAEREKELVTTLTKARALFDGRRLLVVETDAAVRFLTRHRLASMGAVVDECAFGEQALRMLAKQHYDLIVLDLQMPLLDGYALARRIRAGHPGIDPQVCIVAYSSEPMAVAQIKTRKAAMNGFVTKPSDQCTLLKALCDAMEASQARVAAQQVASLAGRAVLLADDNAYIRMTVAASLRAEGVTVVEADNGHKVISRLATMDRCDAILLDIEMPGMDGIETAAAIRASALDCRQAPILALTAHFSPSVLQEARRAGMDDLLVKPFDMARLLEKLHALSLRGALRASEPESSRLTGADTVSLLDIKRLDNLRRIGVLDELMTDYLPAIDRLLGEVEASAKAQSTRACCEALHSLVGMSGEAGARALHRLARQCYEPLVEEGRWPVQADWTAALRELATQTRRALTDYTALPEAVKD